MVADENASEPKSRRLIVGRDVGVRDLVGWPAISGFVGRSVWWCRKMASRKRKPMPVGYEGDKRVAVAFSSQVKDWLHEHNGLTPVKPD